MSRTPPVNFLRHAALMNALGRGMSPSELLFSWWRSRIMSSTYLSRHTFTRESADLTGDAVVTALSLMGPTPSASRSIEVGPEEEWGGECL